MYYDEAMPLIRDTDWEMLESGGFLPEGPPQADLQDVWDNTFDDIEQRERELSIVAGQLLPATAGRIGRPGCAGLPQQLLVPHAGQGDPAGMRQGPEDLPLVLVVARCRGTRPDRLAGFDQEDAGGLRGLAAARPQKRPTGHGARGSRARWRHSDAFSSGPRTSGWSTGARSCSARADCGTGQLSNRQSFSRRT